MPRSARRNAPRAIGSRASPQPKLRKWKSSSFAPRPDLLCRPAGRLAGGRRNPPEYLLPVAIRPLAEQARGRIPGTVFGSEQPAPVRNFTQSDKGWLAERAGKMRVHRIRCDHQIERIDQRDGVE